ncbi:unnamed protein product [Symbiodinium microadriaticum]|nr:unnamed protein product [Symbiodinium microadriaticum]
MVPWSSLCRSRAPCRDFSGLWPVCCWAWRPMRTSRAQKRPSCVRRRTSRPSIPAPCFGIGGSSITPRRFWPRCSS